VQGCVCVNTWTRCITCCAFLSLSRISIIMSRRASSSACRIATRRRRSVVTRSLICKHTGAGSTAVSLPSMWWVVGGGWWWVVGGGGVEKFCVGPPLCAGLPSIARSGRWQYGSPALGEFPRLGSSTRTSAQRRQSECVSTPSGTLASLWECAPGDGIEEP
jgi:hypothetical protein